MMTQRQTIPPAQSRFKPENNPFLVYLTCFYIIIWYLQVGDRIEILATIRLEFIIGSFLTIAAIFTRTTQKQQPNNITKFIIWYFIALIIQIPLSANVDNSLNIFIERVVKFSMIALFISTFIRDTSALKLLIFAYLLASFKLGLEGFIGWKTGGLVWQNQGIMRLHGSITELAHPNSFSGFGVGLLPFIFYLFPVSTKPYKIFLSILFIFSIVIIVFTGSRTGYVATAGFIGYFIYKSQYKLKATAIFILIILISTPLIPQQYFERLESIYTHKDKEGNSSGKRIQILEDAVDIFISNPLGVGVAAFPIVRKEIFGREQDTHNLYLQILTNIGIQGFIIFLLLISAIIKNLKTNKEHLETILKRLKYRHIEQPKNLLIQSDIKNIEFIIAVSKTITAFIVVRLFLGLFGMDLYEIYWWLAIGIAISIHNIAANFTLSSGSQPKEPEEKIS